MRSASHPRHVCVLSRFLSQHTHTHTHTQQLRTDTVDLILRLCLMTFRTDLYLSVPLYPLSVHYSPVLSCSGLVFHLETTIWQRTCFDEHKEMLFIPDDSEEGKKKDDDHHQHLYHQHSLLVLNHYAAIGVKSSNLSHFSTQILFISIHCFFQFLSFLPSSMALFGQFGFFSPVSLVFSITLIRSICFYLFSHFNSRAIVLLRLSVGSFCCYFVVAFDFCSTKQLHLSSLCFISLF